MRHQSRMRCGLPVTGPHSAPIPHPQRAMAAAFFLPLCPSHVPLVKAMSRKLGKDRYVFALVFHKNACQLMSTSQLFFALVSSHVCYVALLLPSSTAGPVLAGSNNGDGGNEASSTVLHPLTEPACPPCTQRQSASLRAAPRRLCVYSCIDLGARIYGMLCKKKKKKKTSKRQVRTYRDE